MTPTVHMIRRGDTLAALAGRYLGSTARWREIIALNPGLSPRRLQIGDRILIPTDARPATRPAEPAPSASPPRWMKVAINEMHVREVSGPGDNPRIVEYHRASDNLDNTPAQENDSTPWCASFVNWVFEQEGIPGTRHALASSWRSWGQEVPGPRYGAVVVFYPGTAGGGSGHVGFVVDWDATHIYCLGGNQSDAVTILRMSLSRVHSYRWPA